MKRFRIIAVFLLVISMTFSPFSSLLLQGVSNAEAGSVDTPRLSRQARDIGKKKSFTLKVRGTKYNVRWKVSDRSLASVKMIGKNKARIRTKKKAGTFIVRATVSGRSLYCLVRVAGNDSMSPVTRRWAVKAGIIQTGTLVSGPDHDTAQHPTSPVPSPQPETSSPSVQPSTDTAEPEETEQPSSEPQTDAGAPVMTGLSVSCLKDSLLPDETVTKDDLVVTASYSDGTSAAVTDYQFSVAVTGVYKIITVYCGSTASVSVPVRQPETESEAQTEAVLTGIRIQPLKQILEPGETITKDDLAVTAVYSDGSETAVTDYQMDTRDNDGEETVSVSYNGKSSSVSIPFVIPETEAPKAETLNIVCLRDHFIKNDPITKEDLTVTAVYPDGTEKIVSDYQFDVEYGDSSDKITVSYDGITAEAAVDTIVPVESIKIK